MSISAKKHREARLRRHRRVRKKVQGTAQRPRLAVYRSNKHITAQLIDDQAERTLAAATSNEGGFGQGGNVEAAARVGKLIAERGRAAEIDTVVFDRGGNLYHGRIAALAEAAREGGLEF